MHYYSNVSCSLRVVARTITCITTVMPRAVLRVVARAVTCITTIMPCTAWRAIAALSSRRAACTDATGKMHYQIVLYFFRY